MKVVAYYRTENETFFRFGRKRTTLVGMVLACVASIIGVVFRMHQDYVYDGKFAIYGLGYIAVKYIYLRCIYLLVHFCNEIGSGHVPYVL